MSNKAQALVWDLECPAILNGIVFQPEDKFVLIAYADHADHFGRSIFPAVITIAHKTGFSERTVQRRTRKLEEIGLLISDGMGPRGSNRWRLPINSRGDKLTPVSICQGDRIGDSLGDNSSGDNSLGDKLTPKSINEQYIYIYLDKIFCSYEWWHKFTKEIEKANIQHDGESIVIAGLEKKAAIMQERYGATMNRSLAVTEFKQIVFME